MSESDKARWNHRYATGDYGTRTYPSDLVQKWLPLCRKGNALDLACGSGRNSVFLANSGFHVTGLDLSEVAVRLAGEKEYPTEYQPQFGVQDLDHEPVRGKYDLIIMVRYVNLALTKQLLTNLNAGGILMVEEHLLTEDFSDLAGPQDPRFRVAPGVLSDQVAHGRILHTFEGLTSDSDRRRVALSQIVVRNSYPT